MNEYAVFGSPKNTDHGRECGCQIRFRPPVKTRLEDTGYDVFACPAHGAGHDLLAVLKDVVDAWHDELEHDSAVAVECRMGCIRCGLEERANAAIKAATA